MACSCRWRRPSSPAPTHHRVEAEFICLSASSSRKSSSSLFSTSTPSESDTLASLLASCSLMSSQADVAMFRLSFTSRGQLVTFSVQSGASTVGRIFFRGTAASIRRAPTGNGRGSDRCSGSEPSGRLQSHPGL